MQRAIRLIAPTLALLVLTGCGYSSSGLYRGGVDSVYVNMFETRTFRRNLEFQLTEAVKKRINMHTPYKLESRERADTILEGEVLEERQASFAPDFGSRIPREIQLTLAVRLKWKDLRTGEVLFDRPVTLQAVDYLTPTGETERYAQQVAIDKMAERIMTYFYNDW